MRKTLKVQTGLRNPSPPPPPPRTPLQIPLQNVAVQESSKRGNSKVTFFVSLYTFPRCQLQESLNRELVRLSFC